MEAFLAQYGLLIILGLALLWLFTKGRRHLAGLKDEAKDATIKALMKEAGIDKLEGAAKVAKVAEIAKKISDANPKKIAGKAIQVLADEAVAAMPDRDLPAPVSEDDDIDGLGAALNKAIKAETKREKWKRGGRKAISIGAKIVGSILG